MTTAATHVGEYGLNVTTEAGAQHTPVADHILLLHGLLAEHSKQAGVPPFHIELVFTADFNASVAQHTGHARFDGRRMAGQVHGKTLSPGDASTSTVVFDCRPPIPDENDPEVQTRAALWLLGHEFTHAMLARMRACAGIWPAPQYAVAPTVADMGPGYASRAVDEWRCDVFGHCLLVALLARYGVDSPHPVPGYFPSAYRQVFGEMLTDTAQREWPEMVARCRNGLMEPFTMYQTLMREVDQMLTLAAHTDAACVISEGKLLPALPDEVGPAARLLQAWASIRSAAVPGSSPLPDFAGFADVETAVRASGAEQLVILGRSVGVDTEYAEDGGLYFCDC
jgi:hypothetical protein